MAEVNSTPKRPRQRRQVSAHESRAPYLTPTPPACCADAMPAHERSVIDAALSILGRYLREPGALLASPQAVREMLRLRLGAQPVECFAVLYLDSQNRLIAFETPFTGTLSQTTVYPREIARSALMHQAAAVILAHNHPSGDAKPSRADEALTQVLKGALAMIDVRVLDHFIVTGRECASMAEIGLV
jgi:DNA repair protein RadC